MDFRKRKGSWKAPCKGALRQKDTVSEREREIATSLMWALTRVLEPSPSQQNRQLNCYLTSTAYQTVAKQRSKSSLPLAMQKTIYRIEMVFLGSFPANAGQQETQHLEKLVILLLLLFPQDCMEEGFCLSGASPLSLEEHRLARLAVALQLFRRY